MKHAFEGVRGTWFLHVEARTSSECFKPYLLNPATEDIECASKASSITEPLGPTDSVTSTDTSDKKGKKGKECREKELQSHKPSLDERTRLVYVSRKNKRKEREREKCFLGYKASGDEAKFLYAGSEKVALPANSSYDDQQASRSVTEVPSETFSEVKSVTSIIRRYFPNSNEKTGFSSPTSSEATSRRKKTKRDHCCSSAKVKSFPKVADQSPSNLLLFPLPANPAEKTLTGSVDRAEVGERLVMATNSLGLFPSKKRSAIHLCRKARHREAASLIRLSVFDISDSDD